MSFTFVSTNSMISSTKFWSLPGTPLVKPSAPFLNSQQKSAPSAIDQNIESRWIAQKPIAAASSAPCAIDRP